MSGFEADVIRHCNDTWSWPAVGVAARQRVTLRFGEPEQFAVLSDLVVGGTHSCDRPVVKGLDLVAHPAHAHRLA